MTIMNDRIWDAGDDAVVSATWAGKTAACFVTLIRKDGDDCWIVEAQGGTQESVPETELMEETF